MVFNIETAETTDACIVCGEKIEVGALVGLLPNKSMAEYVAHPACECLLLILNAYVGLEDENVIIALDELMYMADISTKERMDTLMSQGQYPLSLLPASEREKVFNILSHNVALHEQEVA